MSSIKIISKQEYENECEKPSQKEVWNKIARSWKNYVKEIPTVEEFLKNEKVNIIDIGCGTGRNMTHSPYIYFYGVDFSKEQLKHAKKFKCKAINICI